MKEIIPRIEGTKYRVLFESTMIQCISVLSLIKKCIHAHNCYYYATGVVTRLDDVEDTVMQQHL